MSPQERMKAKMQERAKKKTAEKYTVDQLLEKVICCHIMDMSNKLNIRSCFQISLVYFLHPSQTEECIDNFDFDMARLYCQRALDIEPTNLTILDMLGNICAELGDVEKAKQISFFTYCATTVQWSFEILLCIYMYPVLSTWSF